MTDGPSPDGRTRADRYERAAESFQVFVPGAPPERVADSLSRRQGALGSFAFEVVGELWARPDLSRRDRSLLVISLLAAQSRVEELVLHTEIGIRNGLQREEIEEILLHVAAYAGFPAAMASAREIDEGLRRAEGVDRLTRRSPRMTTPVIARAPPSSRHCWDVRSTNLHPTSLH